MESTKKTSWINKVKSANEQNREQVINLLQITEMAYYDYLLDMGKYYLTDIIQVGVWRDDFLSSGVFWKWWLNHWSKWDAQFLTEAKGTPRQEWHQLYDDIHNANSTQFKPHAAVLEAIFHKDVVQVLTKKEA